MTMKLLPLCLLLGLFHSAWGKKDKCDGSGISSCTECIQQGPPCAWCSDPGLKNMMRCTDRLQMTGCAEAHIYYPESCFSVVKNHLRDPRSDQAFLQPQEINITLMPGAPQSFNLKVFLPEDQPTSSQLTMDFSPIPEGVHITYATLSTQNPLVVQVDVELTRCPVEKNQNSTSTVHMAPRDILPTLDLQLALQCSCECAGERAENSSTCNGHGALVCGGCECYWPYRGHQCEIQPYPYFEEPFRSEEDGCRLRDGALCSGRGDCVDGSCACTRRENYPQEQYTGQFCECSNFDCPRTDNRLCGGHGVCNCGRCQCQRNWTGEECDCSMDTSGCLASNGQLCNGKGSCVCGQCKCHDEVSQGVTCELCPTCLGLCAQHRQCVECRAYGTGSRKSSCEEECSYLSLTKVDSIDDLEPPGVDKVLHCLGRDENDCLYHYTFTPSGEQAWVTKDKAC